jgi:hypothetical protein
MGTSPYGAHAGGPLFDPPGIVQPQESFITIMKQAGSLNAELVRSERIDIQKALEIGRLLLRARPMAQDDWEKTLEEVGIIRQRASDFMWGAQQPPEVQAAWESVADLRRARAEQSIPRTSGMSPQGQGAPSASVNPAAGMASRPPQVAVKCENCKRKGASGLNCEACKALNCRRMRGGGGGRGGRRSKPVTPREPGDEEEPPLVVSLRKKVEQAASKFRMQLNQIARMYKVSFEDGKDGKPAKFDHPLLQEAFDLYLQAKVTALKAEWELRKAANDAVIPD